MAMSNATGPGASAVNGSEPVVPALDFNATSETMAAVTSTLLENVTSAANYSNEPPEKYLSVHAGHEGTHRLMVFMLLFSLLGIQIFLLWWKKRYSKTYHLVSCIGLWLIPLTLSVKLAFWRFVTVWVIFSLVNSYVIKRASKRPLDHLTPAIVYKWYSVMYHVCYAIGSAGYIIFVLTLLGVINIFYSGTEPVQLGSLLLFYGLYFGVLSRDFVEVCSERMAATMGYYSEDGFPRKHLRANVCAVCGAQVDHIPPTAPLLNAQGEKEDAEAESYQLPCKHLFHRNCIKGWCLIGKKDICPYCKERFDRRQFSRNPWDTQQEHYLSLLDFVRYMLVWQPVVFGTLQLFFHMTGME